VLELEVALAPAVPWTECIVVFEDFADGLDFAATFGAAPGLQKKEVCFLGAPIPSSYLGHFAGHLPAGCHAVLVLVAPHAEAGMARLAAHYRGTVSYRKEAGPEGRPARTLLEYTWNHTTLHALKVDRNLTYIQSGFDPARFREQVLALEAALTGEVMMHLEFLRTKEGAFNCSGLQLIRYTSDERLQSIMLIYRDHGVQINDPHVYIVEDGKHRHYLDPGIVAMKHRLDPQGLLNPGKLRSWTGPAPASHGVMPAAA
jgi:hypothetical protein